MNCSVTVSPELQWLGVHEHPGLQELSPWQELAGMSSEVPPKLTPRAILCCRCQSVEQAPEGSEELPEAALPSLCLKQVFPKYAKQFSYLRLVDRVAALFIRFLGVKGTTKLGPTGFRTFIRSVGFEKLALSVATSACRLLPSNVQPVPVLLQNRYIFIMLSSWNT